jgi:drug/metabolite transporter (DMT)-like permease
MLASALSFSVMSVFVKLGGVRLPNSEVVLARAAVTLVLSVAWLKSRRIPMWGKRPGLLLLRGLFGLGGLTCFYYSLTVLPLAEATVIQQTSPILTALLAAVVLRERLDRVLIASLLLSAVGVLVVTRPAVLFAGEAKSLDPFAVMVAVIGAVTSAGAYVVVRILGRSEDPHVTVFYFPLVATPILVPFALVKWVWPTPLEWLYLAAVGLFTQIAQIYLTKGLAVERAGRAISVGYVQILFAALWGVLLFGEHPDAWTLVGISLMISGIVAVALRPPSAATERPVR